MWISSLTEIRTQLGFWISWTSDLIWYIHYILLPLSKVMTTLVAAEFSAVKSGLELAWDLMSKGHSWGWFGSHFQSGNRGRLWHGLEQRTWYPYVTKLGLVSLSSTHPLGGQQFVRIGSRIKLCLGDRSRNFIQGETPSDTNITSLEGETP